MNLPFFCRSKLFVPAKCDFVTETKTAPEFTQFSSQFYSFDVLKRCGGQWLLALCGSVVVMSSCREGRVVRFSNFSTTPPETYTISTNPFSVKGPPIFYLFHHAPSFLKNPKE